MEASLTWRQLQGWRTFAAIEPFGPERDNLHAAMICSVMANAHRGKRGKAFKPEDFMLRDRHAKRQADTQSALAWIQAVAKPKVK